MQQINGFETYKNEMHIDRVYRKGIQKFNATSIDIFFLDKLSNKLKMIDRYFFHRLKRIHIFFFQMFATSQDTLAYQ